MYNTALISDDVLQTLTTLGSRWTTKCVRDTLHEIKKCTINPRKIDLLPTPWFYVEACSFLLLITVHKATKTITLDAIVQA